MKKGISSTDKVKGLVSDLLRIESLIPPQVETITPEFLALWNTIEKLTSEQRKHVQKKKEPASSEKSIETNIKNFVLWINNNGCKISPKIQVSSGLLEGNGIVATDDIVEDEVLLEINPKVMMTQETALNSKIGQQFSRDPIGRGNSVVFLTLHLIAEKLEEKKSFWAPYINVLPKTFSTPPYWTLKDIEELKGSPTQGECIKIIVNIARTYAYLYQVFVASPVVLTPYSFTWDVFIWGFSCVMTRQNKIPFFNDGTLVNKHEVMLGLIPFWDFFNHTNGKITTFFASTSSGGNTCLCHALKSYHPGEQVYIHYADRPTSDLLLNNGFVFTPNHSNYLKIKFVLRKDDPLFVQKATLLQTEDFTFQFKGNALPAYVMIFLRVSVMNEDELNPYKSEEEKKKIQELSVNTVSERNEKIATNLLLNKLKKQQISYPTTKEQDEELLQKLKHNPPQTQIINILTLRIEEKEILQKSIQLVTNVIEGKVLLKDILEPIPQTETVKGIERKPVESSGESSSATTTTTSACSRGSSSNEVKE
eukprot:TRINITY_DN2390_c0_g1_i1.p1 TRINITY_DN2390_c0_g1~~TRINITY_DN2390_c0_g1_i1.p1  ORF type:complete len:536 (-),score=134.07 TRINITY_DN2390_c0_g1_i1:40-1647(-)